jgi:hypothetical protein
MSLDIWGESRSLQTWLDLDPLHGGRAKLLGAAYDLHTLWVLGSAAVHAFPSSPYKEHM